MKLPENIRTKRLLIQAWQAGIASVRGKRVIAAALAEEQSEPITHLLAVGKAASSMCAGALAHLATDGRALVVTKYGHGHLEDAVAAHSQVQVIESGHPVPDENSLRVGGEVAAFVRSVGARGRLVVLVSGGASALVEVLPDGVGLKDLQALTERLLAAGCPIDHINAARMRLSRIKGGKLLRGFAGGSVRVYAISDVPGDGIELIGGGIGAMQMCAPPASPLPREIENFLERLAPTARQQPEEGATAFTPNFDYRARIVATNQMARAAAAEFLRAHELRIVVNEESLHRDYQAAARKMAADLLAGPVGAYIWGGEPTVVLPPKPGIGGRNQSLALALAGEIRGRRHIATLVAGSDGGDGATNAAGALIDGDTFAATSGANRALMRADAATYLARIGALFKPGAGSTGTNVMDLAIAIKSR